jgi:hypothetical protein
MEYSVCTCRWTKESWLPDTFESLLRVVGIGYADASAPTTYMTWDCDTGILGKDLQPTTTPGSIVAGTTDISRSVTFVQRSGRSVRRMGFLDRWRLSRQSPTGAIGRDPREDLAAEVSNLIRAGFVTRSEASRIAAELAEGDYPELSARDVEIVVADSWSALASAQRGWADEGHYRRLGQAFEELESDGIVARMNFACCQTCGHAEIGDEQRDGSWGYTFFHQQDAERLRPGRSDLYLAFGSFGPLQGLDQDLVDRARNGDEDARAEVIALSEVPVARRVADGLTRHGLEVNWNGTNTQRVHVAGLDWRKKLPTG